LTTFSTKCGRRKIPEFARVAYAEAMSITRDSYLPSTTPGAAGPPRPSSERVCSKPGMLSAIPARWAASATSAGPFLSFSISR
jgi:hypothetical protein